MSSRKSFDLELNDITDSLIQMGIAVTKALDKALEALANMDKALALEVVEEDDNIDEMERAIAQRCLRLLLRQQPVASDLRKISTAIKMITDVERIGDAAADIAEISTYLEIPVFPEIKQDFTEMAQVARMMVSNGIDAYVTEDVELARKIREKDDIVDGYFLTIRAKLGEIIRKDPDVMNAAMDYLMIIKYLERVGDHGENICEWVEFNLTGFHKKGRIL